MLVFLSIALLLLVNIVSLSKFLSNTNVVLSQLAGDACNNILAENDSITVLKWLPICLLQ